MRLAILIPAYNSADTIAETLASIAAQSQSGRTRLTRVIVADDGSKDDTLRVASTAWSDVEIPLEIWAYGINRGERVTVNTSFERLVDEGEEWCAVLHSDDVAKENWIERMAVTAEAGGGSVVSICSSWDTWSLNGATVPGENRLDASDVVVSGAPDAAISTLKRGCWWHFSGCFMHLPRFFEVGPFESDMPQLGDLEWLIRASQRGKTIIYIPRTLIAYRLHQGSVSQASFNQNRDLREALLIAERHAGDQSLRVILKEFSFRYSRMALRRFLVSLVRCQWSRASSSLRYALAHARLGTSL